MATVSAIENSTDADEIKLIGTFNLKQWSIGIYIAWYELIKPKPGKGCTQKIFAISKL